MYKRRVFNCVFLLIACCVSFAVRADERITEKEFRDLARDLAPKVNLFKEVWRQDPEAMFYGGTSRDFLYWILGKLQGAKDRTELESRMKKLRSMRIIDIKDIVGSESDADVVSDKVISLEAASYGIRKLDPINPERLSSKTEYGRAEVDQGYIPVEKIGILKSGVVTSKTFGNGVKEMLTGKLTVHFTPDKIFWSTYWAKENLNHPAMLALRYLRIRASHWYHTEGPGLPDKQKLFDFDAETKAKIRSLLKAAAHDEKFRRVLAEEQGLKLLNSSVLKAFRSYTNPTAAYYLFNEFGYNELKKIFDQLTSINQFLYIQHRDPSEIKKNFDRFASGKNPNEIYIRVESLLPDYKLLHGTKTDESFRGILFQNALPSDESKTAGRGLYAVPSDNEAFAAEWGGDANRIVVFTVSKDAKIIDLTQGPGQELWRRWSAEVGGTEDEFARAFGVDILRYSYDKAPSAFVVKNSEVLIERQGLHRQLLSVGMGIKLAEAVKSPTELPNLIELLEFNSMSDEEARHILSAVDRRVLKEVSPSIFQAWSLEKREFVLLIRSLLLSTRLKFLKDLLKQRKPSGYWFDKLLLKWGVNLGQREELISSLLEEGPQNYSLVFDYLMSDAAAVHREKKLKDWADLMMKEEAVVESFLEAWTRPPTATEWYPSNRQYVALAPFLDAMMKNRSHDRQLLLSKIPLLRPERILGMVPWQNRATFRDWVDANIEIRGVESEVMIEYMLAASRQSGRKGPQPKMVEWMERLIKSNPKAAPRAFDTIVHYNLSSSRSIQAVIDTISKAGRRDPFFKLIMDDGRSSSQFQQTIFEEAIQYLHRHARDRADAQLAMARYFASRARMMYVRDAGLEWFSGLKVTDSKVLNSLDQALSRVIDSEGFTPDEGFRIINGIIKANGLESAALQRIAILLIKQFFKEVPNHSDHEAREFDSAFRLLLRTLLETKNISNPIRLALSDLLSRHQILLAYARELSPHVDIYAKFGISTKPSQSGRKPRSMDGIYAAFAKTVVDGSLDWSACLETLGVLKEKLKDARR